jgi:hypothetical protein
MMRAGDVVRFNGGFGCMRAGDVFVVHSDCTDDLFVMCDHGRHYIYLEEQPDATQFDMFTLLSTGQEGNA